MLWSFGWALCGLLACGGHGPADDTDASTGTGAASSGGTTDTGDGPGEVADNVYIVASPGDVIVSADRLVFPRASHPELEARVPGDILVADRGAFGGTNPDGFIRRVVGIALGDVIEVETEQAYLTEVFERAEFHGVLEWAGDAASARAGGSVGAVTPRALTLFSHEFSFSGLEFTAVKLEPPAPIMVLVKGIPVDIKPELSIVHRVGKGELGLSAQVGLDLDIGILDGLRQFGWWMGGDLSTELVTETELTMSVSAVVNGASEAEKADANRAIADWLGAGLGHDLGQPDLSDDKYVVYGTLWIYAVPIPYTVTVDLTLECTLAALKGQATATAGAAAAGSFKVGSEWTPGAGWALVKAWDWSQTTERSLTAALTVTAGCELRPTVELIVAGVAGPSAYISLSSELTLAAELMCVAPEPTPTAEISLELATEVVLGGAARLGVVVPALEINETLLEATLEASVISEEFGPWSVYKGQPALFKGFGCGRCGDGLVEPGEACDDGNLSDNDSCLTNCVPAVCGDGFINTGEEECEDGNGDNNDGCPGCEFAVCGDGWVYTGVEECDDGNDTPDDACSELCKLNP